MPSPVPPPPREPGPCARALVFDGLPRRTVGNVGVVTLCLGVVCWLASTDRLTPQRLLLLLPAVFAAAWLVRTVILHQRGIRAFRHGVPASGRIVCFAGPTRRAGRLEQPPLVLTWEFEHSGALHRGSVSSRDHRLLRRLFPGEVLTVLHLPGAPWVNAPWVDEALAHPSVATDLAGLSAAPGAAQRPAPDARGATELAAAPAEASTELAGVPPPPRTAGLLTKSICLASTGPEDTQIVKAGAALGVAILAALIFGWGYAGELLLELEPVACSGVVTVRETNTMVRSNGRDATRIGYRYSHARVEHEGSVNTTDDALIARAAPGSVLPVEASATFPSLSRLKGGSYSLLGFAGGSFVALLVVGLLAMGLVLLAPPLFALRRRRRAYREGRAAPGRVVEGSLDLERDEPRRRGRIEYEYTVAGERLFGSLTSWNHRQLDLVIPKDALIVLYLPEEPSVHAVLVQEDFGGLG